MTTGHGVDLEVPKPQIPSGGRKSREYDAGCWEMGIRPRPWPLFKKNTNEHASTKSNNSTTNSLQVRGAGWAHRGGARESERPKTNH